MSKHTTVAEMDITIYSLLEKTEKLCNKAISLDARPSVYRNQIKTLRTSLSQHLKGLRGLLHNNVVNEFKEDMSSCIKDTHEAIKILTDKLSKNGGSSDKKTATEKRREKLLHRRQYRRTA